jgi:hypothetical protein
MSLILNGQGFKEDYLALEDGTDNLYRNVSKELPFYAAQNPRRAQI